MPAELFNIKTQDPESRHRPADATSALTNPGIGLKSLDSKVYLCKIPPLGSTRSTLLYGFNIMFQIIWINVLDFGCSDVMRDRRPCQTKKRIKKRDVERQKANSSALWSPLGPKPSICW